MSRATKGDASVVIENAVVPSDHAANVSETLRRVARITQTHAVVPSLLCVSAITFSPAGPASFRVRQPLLCRGIALTE